jgi:hypothetical protein
MELRGSTLLDDRGETCGTASFGPFSRRRATLAAAAVEWTLVRTGGSSVRVTGTTSMRYEARKRARQRLWTNDWRSGATLP